MSTYSCDPTSPASKSGAVGVLHEKLVHTRRVRVLADHLVALIPPKARVLDVGCGDGTIDSLMMAKSRNISVEGIDVLVRPTAKIPVLPYDGIHIPFSSASFDVVMLVDVLHHANDPLSLLREAIRVGKYLVIKDHFRQGLLASTTLRIMDWIGNAHHGVALHYTYWSPAEWASAFDALGLRSTETRGRLGLYPAPASWVFERALHFIGRFERSER
jgi:SAM-dependent methyltransferase